MALLTTDDIVNKKFQPTKFREGYDQDEVDDFLDEVVKTLDELQSENNTLREANHNLREQLEAANRQISELQSGETGAAPVLLQSEPEPTPVNAEPAATAGGPQANSEPESATSMLALAQRLHDEYVQNGQQEGEEIISKARAEADQIVKDAEGQHSRILAQLDQERSLLERKIEELRTFEAEYRAKMRSFLESILGDLADGGSPQPGREI